MRYVKCATHFSVDKSWQSGEIDVPLTQKVRRTYKNQKTRRFLWAATVPKGQLRQSRRLWLARSIPCQYQRLYLAVTEWFVTAKATEIF